MPMRADSIHFDPLSRFYPIFHRFPQPNALQFHLPKKSKLKARHMMLEFRLKRGRKSATSGHLTATVLFSVQMSKLDKLL